MVTHAVVMEETLQCRAALFRVPAVSYIADGPSRDWWEETRKLGAVRASLPANAVRKALALEAV